MEKLGLAVTRRILRFLGQEAKRDPEKYNKFFKGYSYYLKAGVLEDKEANFGRHRDDLLKLLRFECSNNAKGEIVSLAEYAETAKEGQKNIYYCVCPDRKTALASPFMEQFLQRERNVLLMYEDIDEYLINAIENYKDMQFVSVDSGDKDFELDLDQPKDSDTDKDNLELTESEQKDLSKFIKDVLKERVQEVKFSNRLVSSPAVVTSIMTPHMRKMMKTLMAGKESDGISNIPVTLELSAKHHIVTTLNSIKTSNTVVAQMSVEQLFDNASIAAGTLEDPRTLMSRLNKVLEMFIYQGAGFDYAQNKYVVSADQSASTTSKHEEVKLTADAPKFEEVKSS